MFLFMLIGLSFPGSLATQPTAPNTKRMYRFYVPEESAPAPGDPPCITFLYHSAVDPVRDVYSGLVGPLLLCRKGSLDHEGMQVSRVLVHSNKTRRNTSGGSKGGHQTSPTFNLRMFVAFGHIVLPFPP